MLFKAGVLDGIGSGAVTLAFRRWAKPSVREGSTIRTAAGVIEITAVTQVKSSDIGNSDARNAGYASPEALLASLRQGPGQIYRIALRLIGADPRAALRAAIPSAQELDGIKARLARMDASRDQPWTLSMLRLIAEQPGSRARDLADIAGREMLAFKTDVRKLKELGLTESLETGYRLSPRGRAVIRHLTQKKAK